MKLSELVYLLTIILAVVIAFLVDALWMTGDKNRVDKLKQWYNNNSHSDF